jgi:hypothetical protein
MNASTQLGQSRRTTMKKPATGKPATGGARATETGPARLHTRDAGTCMSQFTTAGQYLTDSYTDAITAGVDPQILERAFSHIADTIARAHLAAAQYEARHRRTAYQGQGVRPVIADAPGYSSCPDPSTSMTAAQFMDALRRYRLWAGSPSLRRMQNQCGGRPVASTLCKTLQANQLPSLEMADAIIVGCGGRDDHREAFASAWRRLAFSQHDHHD